MLVYCFIFLLPNVVFIALFRDTSGLYNEAVSLSGLTYTFLGLTVATFIITEILIWFKIQFTLTIIWCLLTTWLLFGFSITLLMLLYFYDSRALEEVSPGPTLVNATIVVSLTLISCILLSVTYCTRSRTEDSEDTRYLYLFLLLVLTIFFSALVLSWIETWSYGTAASFIIVTFTTIGYGNIIPTQTASLYIAMFVGIFGIGLTTVVLSSFGKKFVVLCNRISRLFTTSERTIKYLETGLVTLFALGIWFIGAVIFSVLEGWSYTSALFYTFQTLTTVGYGNLIVENPVSQAIALYYAFFGITLFSIFVNLYWSRTEPMADSD